MTARQEQTVLQQPKNRPTKSNKIKEKSAEHA
jgi:hypothetical protein